MTHVLTLKMNRKVPAVRLAAGSSVGSSLKAAKYFVFANYDILQSFKKTE